MKSFIGCAYRLLFLKINEANQMFIIAIRRNVIANAELPFPQFVNYASADPFSRYKQRWLK